MTEDLQVWGRPVGELLALSVLAPVVALFSFRLEVEVVGRLALFFLPLVSVAAAVQAARDSTARQSTAWWFVAASFLLVLFVGVEANTIAPGCNRQGVFPQMVRVLLEQALVYAGVVIAGALTVGGAWFSFREETRLQGTWILGGIVTFGVALWISLVLVGGCPAI